MPDADIGSIPYTIRTHLLPGQTPASSGWSNPANPQFTRADAWLGKPIETADNFRALAFRYEAGRFPGNR